MALGLSAVNWIVNIGSTPSSSERAEDFKVGTKSLPSTDALYNTSWNNCGSASCHFRPTLSSPTSIFSIANKSVQVLQDWNKKAKFHTSWLKSISSNSKCNNAPEISLSRHLSWGNFWMFWKWTCDFYFLDRWAPIKHGHCHVPSTS